MPQSGWGSPSVVHAVTITSMIVYGQTDDYCYNVVQDPVHVHDLNATILHCFGIDHTKLTFKFQGRHYRITDVEGQVAKQILI